MKKIKYLIYIFVLLAFQACDDGFNPDVSLSGASPIVSLEQLVNENDYSLFAAALDHAGITAEVLNASDSITVFAPDNKAFQGLLNDLGASSVTDIDATTLASVLRYHVASGVITSDALPRSITTLNGASITTVTMGGPSLNGKSDFLVTDLYSAQGVFHGISTVLSAPVGSLTDVIAADTAFSILSAALERVGLDATLNGTTQFTVMAPTNEAFRAAGLEDLSGLTDEELTDILSFHVLSGMIFLQEVPVDSRFPSILGAEDVGQVQININGDAEFNGAPIDIPNFVATNGVVHKMGALIFEDFVLADVVGRDTNVSGNDAFGLDDFGDIVTAVGYERFDDLALTSTIYAAFADIPAPADFATDADAIEYIEQHTFDGDVQLTALDNGTKVTAVSGDSYFVTKTAAGNVYVNGDTGSRNGFGSTSTASFPVYDGRAYIWRGSFTPLPERSISEVLGDSANFSLLVKALEVAEAAGDFSSSANTFLAFDNAAFTAEFGYTDVADLDTLTFSDVNDTTTLASISEVIDRHTIPIPYFNAVLASDLPVAMNSLGEEIVFAFNADGDIVISERRQDFREIADYIPYDLMFENGVIHKVDNVISFE